MKLGSELQTIDFHKKNLMRSFKFKVLIGLCLLACHCCATETGAQEVGDRVVVSAFFETKIYKDVVDRVFEGEVHTITSINGKWCALSDVEGWLPLQYVLNLDTAMKNYDKRIAASKQDADALAHRGLIHYENEDYAKAFTDLNESLRINNKNPVTWSNRGMVLNAQQKYALAIADLQYAVKLNPRFPQAHFNLGRVYYAMNDFEKAIASYDEAVKLNPKVPRYFVNRGSARLYARDFDRAKQDYLQALKLDARNADAHIGLSNIAPAQFDLDEAFRQAERAVELQPKNAMALNARGWLLYKQNKVDEAIFDLTRAIRYAPKLSLAYNNRGVCYVAKQEFDKAIADYDEFLKLFPKSPIAISNRGVARMGKGEFELAKADLEEAISLSPEMSDGLNSLAWFLATCPNEQFRNGDEAVAKAKQACELSNWKDWSYIETLSVAQAEKGEFKEAIELATKAKELAPANMKSEFDQRIELFKSEQPYRSNVGKSSQAKPGTSS